MPIDIVSSTMLIAQKQEQVVLMDDYGATYHLYIPVASAAGRQQIIDDGTALLQKNQDAMEQYATTHSIDLTAHKAAGQAKKQALLGKTTSTSAATVPTTTANENANTTTTTSAK